MIQGLCLLPIIAFSIACGQRPPADSPTRPAETPPPTSPTVRARVSIQRHIELAVELQRMPEPERVSALHDHVRRGTADVFVLARMLFEARPGGSCRAPRLGAPMFLGQTTSIGWPLDPITIVDGVPVKVARGYFIGGLVETATGYLDYSVRSCRWTERRYRLKTAAEIETALRALIDNGPWREPLRRDEIAFLEEQLVNAT